MSMTDGFVCIHLNRGHVALVSEGDVEKVAGVKWSVLETGGLKYARRTVRRPDGKQKTILLHRVIMGAADGEFVDHINGDGLDCRRGNMRIVTKAQNNMNRRCRSSNRLGIKGVRKHALCDKYQVEIGFGRKRKYVGLFDTVDEAKAAYATAVAEHHGEYGRVE